MQKIYHNGKIITMTDDVFEEALVTENGIIKALGHYADLKNAYPNAEEFDLKGHTLLPAFIDVHSHLSGVANSFLEVDIKGLSREEIKETVTNFIQNNSSTLGKEALITVNGYMENMDIDLSFIDEISKDHPMVIKHTSGHSGFFNSKAMELLGINSATGYFNENEYISNVQKLPMPDSKVLLQAYQKAQDTYASYGITCTCEGFMALGHKGIYQSLINNEALKLDVNAYVDYEARDELLSVFSKNIREYQNGLKIMGIKQFLDGSPQSKTALMRTPYEGENNCGHMANEPQKIGEAIDFCLKNNLQHVCHCNGDKACDIYIDELKTRPDVGKIRPVIIHAQLINTDRLDEVAQLGIIPSFFVAHIYHFGDIHIKNFGYSRASSISPLYSCQKRNIPFTLHQDSPVIHPDMMESIWCAVNRKTGFGSVLGRRERVNAYEALKAVTINAAHQIFEENRRGSIDVGKLADFVVLDKDPLSEMSYELKDIKVLMTIKKDDVIYRRQS
ncbi:MAG: amidohydrolase [Lachnospiraceae bacterium]